MYTALYRKFRPETFDEVLGQEHIVRILKNQINTDTTSHAYLFCGTRGTGKTTSARLLAKGVNCLAGEGEKPCGQCANCQSIKNGTFMDVIEIDAASNNGVENIRELKESVKYPPVTGRCKVYIIDEVHMLSTGAFNALLKTLEEPPESVMFILATTEPQKLPATVLSRCLRLDFHRVPEQKLRAGMKDICDQLGIEISESALGLIAANADGSVRDGLSLLDQCISAGEKTVSREDVLELLGTSGEEVFIEMTELVCGHNPADALLLLNRILDDGKDVRQFMKDWVAHFRSLMMTQFIKNPEDVLNMSSENVERIRAQSRKLSLETINECILELSKTLSEAKWSTQPRILLELCIVKLAAVPVGKMAPMTPAAETPAAMSGSNGAASPGAFEEKATTGAPPEQSGTAAVVSQDYDLEELWHQIFEDGAQQKSSFNLLRSGTQLTRITEKSFFVEAANEMAKRFAEENIRELEELMEKHTGHRLMMECRMAGADTEAQANKVEELAQSMEQALGISIEIQ